MYKKAYLVSTFLIGFLLLLTFWGNNETIQYAAQEDVAYGFSLTEIVERIEYIYQFKTLLKPPDSMYFGELGSLPQKKKVNISIYLAKGNKVLFLPDSKANSNIQKEGISYKTYYSEKMKGYMYYFINDKNAYEAGIPVNSLESSYLGYCMVTDEKSADQVYKCSLKGIEVYEFNDLQYLGNIQADFGIRKIPCNIPSIDIDNNEYIKELVGYLSEVLAQTKEYGNYIIYLNDMHRIQQDRQSFGWTYCYIDCVIEGNGRREYAEFVVYDDDSINGRVFPLSGPNLENSQGYFSDYYIEENDQTYIQNIIEQKRGIVTFEVTHQSKQNIKKEDSFYNDNDNGYIDFRKMPTADIGELLSYVCSYGEWFGMNELGCQVGEICQFHKQKIIMYSWENKGDTLFFLPEDKVNTYLKGSDGEQQYPVYINEMGEMEFYQLKKGLFTDNSGQLNTSFITRWKNSTRYIEYLVKIGDTEELKIEKLSNWDIIPIKEDKFIQVFCKQVKELLAHSNKHGTYMVQIGEYESLFANKACISAAIIGQQAEYYIRYLIVEYGNGQYYFWPVGFGINGSLEECKNDKHSMNKICIDRTKALNRTKIEITVQ